MWQREKVGSSAGHIIYSTVENCLLFALYIPPRVKSQPVHPFGKQVTITCVRHDVGTSCIVWVEKSKYFVGTFTCRRCVY